MEDQIPLVLNDEGIAEWLATHLPEVIVTAKKPLTEFLQRDEANGKRLGRLPEGGYKQWVDNVHKSNLRDIAIGQGGANLAMSLASMLTMPNAASNYAYGALGLSNFLTRTLPEKDNHSTAYNVALSVIDLTPVAMPAVSYFPKTNTGRAWILGGALRRAKPLEITLPAPKTRVRLGDVEINDPNLAYRLGGPKIVDDFIKTGLVLAKSDEAPEKIIMFNGVPMSFTKNFSDPMFALGDLWYGIPEEGTKTGLLVTAEPLQVATQRAAPYKRFNDIKGTFDVRGNGTLNGGRRIPLSETLLNPSNTRAYIWDPNYGYRRYSPSSKIPSIYDFSTKLP